MSKKSHKGSLFYQLINSPNLNRNANREGITTSYKTQENYRKSLHYAADFLKSVGIRNSEQIDIENIQQYADYLRDKGYSASTVHTYLAPVCKVADIPMDQIKKPIRYVANYVKCRTKEIPVGEADPVSDNRTILLNQYLGLRRSELTRLHGNDLHQDKYGNWYVYVDRGKGGKSQRQYILPPYVDAVRAFFNGSDNLIFRKADMDSKYNYHAQRHALAKNAYEYYAGKIAADPEFAKRLYVNIAESWHHLNRRDRNKLEPRASFDSKYYLRGKNRDLALKTRKPIAYDRLALRAVSVLHLAHWRDNITIDYLLS